MKPTKLARWLLIATSLMILNCRTTAALFPEPTSVPTVQATRTPTKFALATTPTPTVTATRTPTRRPVVPTATRTMTPLPLPTVVPPAPSPHSFRVESVRCYHSGQSFVEGLVLENADPHSGLNGVKVRISAQANGPPAADYETREHFLSDARFRGSYNGYFWFGVNAGGAAPGETRYVWVVDASGKALSDPNAAKAIFNNFGPDDPRGACWNIQIIFVRFQG